MIQTDLIEYKNSECHRCANDGSVFGIGPGRLCVRCLKILHERLFEAWLERTAAEMARRFVQ